MSESRARLRRTLGLGQLTASGIGIIIGAGIYVLLGAATDVAGTGVWLGFVVAGGLSALTALSYAELAAMYPTAGAEYEYTRRVAAPSVAFLVGWVMIAGLVVAAAAVALGFATYFRSFVDVPIRIVAIGLLVGVTLIAVRGIQRSAAITVVLSLIQVGGLVAIIAIGVPHLGDHSLVDGVTFGGVVSGAALVFFAFIGFDEVITLAEETAAPTRTVPRALLLALGISTLLYVGVAIAGLSVLGPRVLAASDQPLADVVRTAIGSTSADVVAVVALVATTNTTLLCLTAASRLQYGMADTAALPRWFGALNTHRAPWRAITGAAVLAALFVLIGDITLVASVTDVAVYLVFIAVNATVIALRVRQPNRRRPFRVPWSIGPVPLPALAGIATVVVLIPSLDLAAIATGAGLCLLGIVAYALIRRHATGTDATHERPEDGMRRTKITIEDARRVAAVLRIDFAAVEFDAEELRHGMQMELQHGRADPDTNVTDDDLTATAKIALAHLHEIPDYYDRLAAMETEAREEWSRRRTE